MRLGFAVASCLSFLVCDTVLLERLPHKSVVGITLDHHTCTRESTQHLSAVSASCDCDRHCSHADGENRNPVFAAPPSILSHKCRCAQLCTLLTTGTDKQRWDNGSLIRRATSYVPSSAWRVGKGTPSLKPHFSYVG